jgi:hypothetical protein
MRSIPICECFGCLASFVRISACGLLSIGCAIDADVQPPRISQNEELFGETISLQLLGPVISAAILIRAYTYIFVL